MKSMVCELVDANGQWNEEILKDWLPVDVLDRINAIVPPENENGKDLRLCPGSRSGKYTVAATYDILCDFDSLNVDSDWRKVLSLKVQERIRHFMWIVKHNHLLTNYRKHKMHLGNAYCRHCGDTIETTMHVLRDCPMAMMIWVRIVDVDFRYQFFNVNLDNWLHLNLNFAGSVNVGKWSELWSITCHSL